MDVPSKCCFERSEIDLARFAARFVKYLSIGSDEVVVLAQQYFAPTHFFFESAPEVCSLVGFPCCQLGKGYLRIDPFSTEKHADLDLIARFL